jgi:signal transduction histidine kinase
MALLNEGVGIRDDEKPRIFERYFKTPDARR